MTIRDARALFPLLLSLLLAGPALADDAPGVVLTNGKLLDGSAVEVLVKGDRIAEVGPTVTGSREGLRVVDAKGGLVLPGLHDAHAHVLGGALAQDQVDLEGKSLEECVEAVRAWAAAHPQAAWVQGRGWSYDIVPRGQFPTRQALDAAVADRPVVLEAYDGHSSWANSKALALAHVAADTKDPENGTIVREADGETPAGALLESAAGLVDDAVPEADRATKKAALARGLGEFRALGLTSVESMCGSPDEVSLYEELADEGALPVRVTVSLPLGTDLRVVAEVERRLRTKHAGWLRLGLLKGFLDGIIESRTAFMLAPYAGHDDRGKPSYTQEELDALVAAANAAGFQVALHAIGDGAVHMALDAYEASNRGRERPVQNRIEHIETVAAADLPRFRALHVIASMQPYHSVPSDAPSDDDVWSANLGPDRLSRAFAWRALLDAGATLAFGSDWPVMTQDPLKGIGVATTRQNERGLPEGGWQAQQRITVAEAVRAYTEGAARADGWEQLGTLTPGALADLVVLSPDVRADAPRTFFQGHVRVVVVGGEVAIERD